MPSTFNQPGNKGSGLLPNLGKIIEDIPRIGGGIIDIILGRKTFREFWEAMQRRPELVKIPVIEDVTKQYIVTTSVPYALGATEEIEVPFGSDGQTRKIQGAIIGISECPVPRVRGEHLILVQFNELTIIGERVLGGGNRFFGSTSVYRNIIISPGHPVSSPPPATSSTGNFTPTPVSDDFVTLRSEDARKWPERADFVIAVMDTGIRPDRVRFSTSAPLAYIPVNIVKGLGIPDVPLKGVGYNGVNFYKRISRDSEIAPESDAMYAAHKSRTKDEITSYAFDDNIGEMISENGRKIPSGAHGTHVSALISDQLEEGDFFGILPVKAFDNRGNGTLFDVVCCFDYILHQFDNGLPVKVVNLSWVSGSNDRESVELIGLRIAELHRRKIWVVAAAGNNGVDLNVNVHYPACFSSTYPNVITVASLRTNAQTGVVSVASNYSNQWVDIGVESEPYHNKLSDAGLYGSSFATAIVSARLANYLRRKSTARTISDQDKQEFISSTTIEDPSLLGHIRGGRKAIILRPDAFWWLQHGRTNDI